VAEDNESINQWPMKTATVKLARNPRAKVPEGEEQPYHKPPTENGSIRIGMDVEIFLPSRAVQQIGFTPYKLVPQVISDTSNETDLVPVDATVELMRHYAGIYKYLKPLGEGNGN